jgi:PHS family inorganic phosphate transporter-like MFS transporter
MVCATDLLIFIASDSLRTGLELILIIFATLAQALTAGSPSVSIIGVIIFWRVLMGVGIGGDYPLSSIITSE